MKAIAHIICIGNEIMLGHINNTNSQYLSRRLSCLGVVVSGQLSIPDKPDLIIKSIKASLKEANIVILTGGLGPTVDDITLECIASALNRKLIFNKKIADSIKGSFKKRKLKMPEDNMRQAFLPKGAKSIPNNIGTAPGLIINTKRKLLMAFPGVPFELYPMFEKFGTPYIKKIFNTRRIIVSRVIKIAGLPESTVNEKIKDILGLTGKIEMGIYPHPQEISVKITVTEKDKNSAHAIIKKVEKDIESRLGKYIFGYDEQRLEDVTGNILSRMKKTLAVAESCTGGLLANRITNTPGSSKYFLMGLVTYSNNAKNKLLNIPLTTIKKYGAVSKKVAFLMARNVQILSGSDIGIGVSGIAGPGGGTRKKPVGLVYIALSTKDRLICKELHFTGQREIIRQKATQAALNLLRLTLHLM